MLDENVLARIFLHAVLASLEIMAEQDSETKEIAHTFTGTISLVSGLRGPRATLAIADGGISLTPWKIHHPDIVFFFPTNRMLNRTFAGKTAAFPLPVKGITRIRGLKVLSKLLKRMEHILQQDTVKTDLKARCTLHIMARALETVANHEEESCSIADNINGIIEFIVRGIDAVHVDFTGDKTCCRSGSATDPDLIFEFSSGDMFLGVAEDRVDVMAQICLETISFKGNLHMGQAVNILLDRVGYYLH